MSRIRGPYVRFCERDEAVTPHPTQFLCQLMLLLFLLLASDSTVANIVAVEHPIPTDLFC